MPSSISTVVPDYDIILSMRFLSVVYGLWSVVCFTGCSQPLETQAEQTLQKDPSFGPAWEKKQLVQSEIATLRAQFEAVKNDLDSKIGQLREELKGHENDFKQKSQVLQEKMRPEMEDLSQTTKNLEAQLKETREQFRRVEEEARDLEKEIQRQADQPPAGTSQSTAASSDSSSNASKDELANQFSRKVVQREELKLQVKKLENELRLRKQQARLLLSW